MSFQLEIDKAIKEKRLYFIGDALPPDWYAAFRLWLPLADAGDAKAQYNIGRCYSRGDGVEQDSIKAKDWYLKAAEQNDPRALFNLHLIYSDEKSTEKDLEKAEDFLTRAAQFGEARAINTVQKREIENQKKEFIRISREAEKSLNDLISNGKFSEAKTLILDNTNEQLAWLKDYFPYFDIQLIRYEITSEIEKTYSKTGVFRGTTVNGVFTGSESYDETKYIKYKANIWLKNNSEKVLSVGLVDSSNHVCSSKAIKPNSESCFTIDAKYSSKTIVGYKPESFDNAYPPSYSVEGFMKNRHYLIINGTKYEEHFFLRPGIFKFENHINIPRETLHNSSSCVFDVSVS